MGLKAIARLAPVLVQYRTSAGEAADVHIFVADRDYEIMDVRETHSVAGASSSTLDVGISASGTAPASLTTSLSSTFALDSTVNTPVQATLTSTLAARKMDKGDQISPLRHSPTSLSTNNDNKFMIINNLIHTIRPIKLGRAESDGMG